MRNWRLVAYLLSQRECVAWECQKRSEAVDDGVDGQRIRLPGYLLPLKLTESGATEFLLVPWVGVCIHTPPLPPNQMLHVAVPGGVASMGRFVHSWVEREINLWPDSYRFSLWTGAATSRSPTPAQRVADLVHHRAFALTVAARIPPPTALQILLPARFAHDSR